MLADANKQFYPQRAMHIKQSRHIGCCSGHVCIESRACRLQLMNASTRLNGLSSSAAVPELHTLRQQAAGYEALSGAQRLALLDALIHTAADSEGFRAYILGTAREQARLHCAQATMLPHFAISSRPLPQASCTCCKSRTGLYLGGMLLQAQGPEGRQARALGQDAAGRRYYRLGGEMGATRIFVDAGPAAAPAAASRGSAAAADAADDKPAAGLLRSSSIASGVQGSSPAAEQQPQMAPVQPQPFASSQLQWQQPQQQTQLLSLGPPVDAAWGWYEADQLPALLKWLEDGDDGERALADALFEAMLPLLPGSLASTAPSQVRTPRPCISVSL